jgi:hypothetical protein
MRGYWIKIGLKAFAIFVVGMIIVTGVRKAKGSINHAINSSDPIPIPVIGLVPFNLDSHKLGSVSRVEFLRSDPEHVSGVRVLVKLGEGVSPDVLAQCQLALDDIQKINDQTTFTCAPAGEAIGGLEQFGVVAIKNSSDSFPLLLPAEAIAKLRATTFSFRNGKVKIDGPPSPAELLAARTDSLHGVLDGQIDAQSDSIDTMRELASDLEDSAAAAPRDLRRALQRQADSVTSAMRLLVDRMKANEGRMHALEKLSQIRELRRDWKPAEGATIADSVTRLVNDELARVQLELERQGITNVRVNMQFDSATAAAMREGIRVGRGAAARGTGSAAGSTAAEPARTSRPAPAPKAAPTPPVAPTPAVEKP